MTGPEPIQVRVAFHVGSETYDLGEAMVPSVEEANEALPALLRRIADEYEAA